MKRGVLILVLLPSPLGLWVDVVSSLSEGPWLWRLFSLLAAERAGHPAAARYIDRPERPRRCPECERKKAARGYARAALGVLVIDALLGPEAERC
jgi:hypothetical protein